MQQLIRFKGLSLTPDEMAVENGALSLCGNLELHDGALRPSILQGTKLPSPLVVSGTVARLTYVHETSEYKHLIAISGSDVYWFNQEGVLGSSSPIKYFDYQATVLSINSIGNTLVIVATDGLHYVQWLEGSYHYLGQKPPFMDISFNISVADYYEDYDTGGVDADGSKYGFDHAFQQTTLSCGDAYSKVAGTSWNPGDLCVNIKEDKQSDLTQSIYALVNRTNNLIARKGRFYANFFIRYCYRMYDGTMFMHSCPVFIPVQVPNNYDVYAANFYFPKSSIQDNGSIKNAEVNWKDKLNFQRPDASGTTLNVKVSNATFYYHPRNVSLSYFIRTVNNDTFTELEKWKDIIKSVDFFITPPITNVDTSEKISNLQIADANYSLGYGERKFQYATGDDTYGYVKVKFPATAEDTYRKKLLNSSSYFKVCSIPTNEIRTKSSGELPVDKNAVYKVSLQEQMKDDYKTHNHLYAQGSYVYNHRLNLYGCKEKLFEGFSNLTLLPNASFIKKPVFNNPIFGNGEQSYSIKKIVVRLNTTSGTKYVEKEGFYLAGIFSGGMEQYMLCNCSKFYPDTRADKMVFFTVDGDGKEVIFAFDLTECDELNGAIHMGTFEDDGSQYKVSSFDYTVDDIVALNNKIYTSEAGNPYYFPVNAINTVGIGTILGIASSTRALSQGQFGQYPLMAFTTDGVWALNVSANGTYSSIHPISREVCSNVKSITQLDQSVLFTTDRALNKIVESQIASFSDVLDGPYFNIASMMPEAFDWIKENTTLQKLIDFDKSPISFFQNCQFIYDYKNSRIFCIDTDTSSTNDKTTVALCYSLRDGTWSTLLVGSPLVALNSYPHPYIQYKDGSVTCLDKGYDYNDGNAYDGIIVTRTLKLDEDECPDSITGYVHSLTSKTIPLMWLYGSNDNQNWHYIGRVGGYKSNYMATKSYRYFRIGIFMRMLAKSQYMATRLNFVRKFGKI